jgi:hypothetical protein
MSNVDQLVARIKGEISEHQGRIKQFRTEQVEEHKARQQ